MATEVDRIVVMFTANIQQVNKKLDDLIAKSAKAAKKVEESWNGRGLTAGLEKGFDSLAEHAGEAAHSIPGLGAALGVLGPAGLAAAAGIAAVVESFAKAREAADWAEEVEQGAKRLGLTAEELQKLDLTAKATGLSVETMRGALQSLGMTIGTVQDNFAKGKNNAGTKAFMAILGIDDPKKAAEQLRSLGGDLSAFIPVIVEYASKLSATQQLGLAKALKLDPEVLAALIEGRENIEELTKATHDFRIIADSDLIATGAKAANEMHFWGGVIESELNVAFAHLAPAAAEASKALAVATGGIADVGSGAATWWHALKEYADQLERISGFKMPDGVGDFLKGAGNAALSGAANLPPGGAVMLGIAQMAAMQGAANRQQQNEGDPFGAFAAMFKPPIKALVSTPPGPKKTDRTGALDKAAQDAAAQAARDLASAQAALATTIDQRTKFEEDAIASELAKKNADIDAQIKEIRATTSLTDAHAAEQIATLELAKQTAGRAALAKIQSVQQQAQIDKSAASLAKQQALNDLADTALSAQAAHYTALAGLADTVKDRNAAEAKALELQQQADRDRLAAALALAQQDLKAAQDANRPDEVIAAAQAKVDAAQQAVNLQPVKQADEAAALAKANESATQKYLDSLKDLAATMEDAGVTAARDLADGLADAIVNAKSLGDVAANVFKQLIQQVLSAELQKNIFGPILGALGLPAHAAGTLSSASGLAMVGEKGPELVNLPGGSQVISNQALRNMTMGSRPSAQVTVLFDNRGAIIWEQAAKQMMAYADAAATKHGMTAVQTARSTTPVDLDRINGRRLGR